MSKQISVILETAREGGLDWQLGLLAEQTFQDFELILIDGYYDERKDSVIEIAKEHEIDMTYLREEVPFDVGHVRPINVNTCMKYASGKYFVFLDDYHIFPKDFLAAHYDISKLGCAGMVNWEVVLSEGVTDYREITPKVVEEDPRMKYFLDHVSGYERVGDWFIGVPWDWWWPNSTSVPAEYMYKVNGFNELYSGGTGGEDNDVAYRMYASGLKFAYNPSITCYHIQHGHVAPGTGGIPMRSLRHRIGAGCGYIHDRSPFTRNDYWSKGNPDLIENERLFTWFEDGYKVFQCKDCKEFGCVDGQQMLRNTKERARQGIVHPPGKIHFVDGSSYRCTNIVT